MKLAEMLAIEAGACDDADAALDIGVDGIPVYIFSVPVFVQLLTEEQHHGGLVILIGDDHHGVVDMKHGIGNGNDDLVATPDARDDELHVGHMRDVGNLLAYNGRIDDDELRDIGVVVIGERLDL